jgi:hypothetical protein
LSLAALLLVIGTGLPKNLQHLHSNRAGLHAAGLWLADHVSAERGDIVEDDHCWAHYFAGLVFLEDQTFPRTSPAIHYTVISRARDPQKNEQARQKQERELVSSGATLVYHWPVRRAAEEAKVVVYAAARTK